MTNLDLSDNGAASGVEKWPLAMAWLRALRLKFYPMSWLAYGLGALLAAGTASVFTTGIFWTGLVFLVALEAATVLSNEYYDFPTDRRNRFAGPFSGGSRVLVDGLLDFAALRRGIALALIGGAVAVVAVLLLTPAPIPTAILVVVLTLLALGYTVPPLQLSWRSLGELDVGITDSIGVLLLGYLLAGGRWHDPAPWLLSLPLGLAFLPSITLCAVPDHGADREAGKRTLAVRLGIGGALRVAQASALLAALSALWLEMMLLPGSYGPLIYLSLAHALLLCLWLQTSLGRDVTARRIDGQLAAALAFVPWFGLLPLLRLIT